METPIDKLLALLISNRPITDRLDKVDILRFLAKAIEQSLDRDAETLDSIQTSLHYYSMTEDEIRKLRSEPVDEDFPPTDDFEFDPFNDDHLFARYGKKNSV